MPRFKTSSNKVQFKVPENILQWSSRRNVKTELKPWKNGIKIFYLEKSPEIFYAKEVGYHSSIFYKGYEPFTAFYNRRVEECIKKNKFNLEKILDDMKKKNITLEEWFALKNVKVNIDQEFQYLTPEPLPDQPQEDAIVIK